MRAHGQSVHLMEINVGSRLSTAVLDCMQKDLNSKLVLQEEVKYARGMHNLHMYLK